MVGCSHIFVSGVVLLVLGCTPAVGQERTDPHQLEASNDAERAVAASGERPTMRPSVNLPLFEEVVERYLAEPERERIARALFETYEDSIERLVKQRDEELAPLHEKMEAAREDVDRLRRELAPGGWVPGHMPDDVIERVREARQQYRDVINELHPVRSKILTRAGREAARRRDAFLDDLQIEVLDGDTETRASIERFIYRRKFLSRVGAPPRGTPTDFFRRVDIIELFEVASETGGELHDLVTSDDDEAIDALQRALVAYELAVDRRLRRTIQRLLRPEPGPGVYEYDDSPRRRREWTITHGIFEDAVNSIGRIAEAHSGVETRRAWLERWWSEVTPSIPGVGADLDALVKNWIVRLDAQGEDETAGQVRDLHDAFTDRRHGARERAYAAAIEARRWHRFIVGANHERQRRYVRRLLELDEVQDRFIRDVAGALPPELAGAWQAEAGDIITPRVPDENIVERVLRD